MVDTRVSHACDEGKAGFIERRGLDLDQVVEAAFVDSVHKTGHRKDAEIITLSPKFLRLGPAQVSRPYSLAWLFVFHAFRI